MGTGSPVRRTVTREGCPRRLNAGAVTLALGVSLALGASTSARASQLIDRATAGATLSTNAKGEAMVTYRVGGKVKHVLVWGAVNALTPARGRKQVSFSLDYSGGFGKYRKTAYWDSFGGACAAYDGPALAWKVAACRAPDGSYWALQSWQRALSDYGLAPTGVTAAPELRLSHWTGPLAVLDITTDWSYRKYDHLFGTYSYGGTGVYGFSSTSAGNPQDSFGRNIYLDTFDSAYGTGWRRDNSFLTHRAKGSFCYGLFPHGAHPTGKGTKYRATAEGPGVTPDVMWEDAAPGVYDAGEDGDANDALTALDDPSCKPN
jgi:hypothetical protein